MKKKSVAIIGGGASSLLLAYTLGKSFDVTIYEKEKTIARKFLVAGKGGFNLTNELSGDDLKNKYSPNNFLDEALQSFDSKKTRDWLDEIGVPTYVGSSGRVFPEKGIKPIEVLEAIRNCIVDFGVQIVTHHTFAGFDDEKLPVLRNESTEFSVDSDFVVFAMGGASWSQTGSDGKWLDSFEKIGVNCNPFQSSNCGVNVEWNDELKKHHSGKPLKNISLTIGGKTILGEALITDYGLEGNAVYPSVPAIREGLSEDNIASLSVDFKPNNTRKQLLDKITERTSTKDYEKVFHLNKAEMAILKSFTKKGEFTNSTSFVEKIKALQIPINGLRPIDESISTVGGVKVEELNSDLSIKKIPNFYVAGEMIDWDAPTGGFLLQGCFSTAYLVAQSISSLG